MSEKKKSKRPNEKPILLAKSVSGQVLPERGQGDDKPATVHYYENAKSIDVYVWTTSRLTKRRSCVVVRLRRGPLADYIKRTGGLK